MNLLEKKVAPKADQMAGLRAERRAATMAAKKVDSTESHSGKKMAGIH